MPLRPPSGPLPVSTLTLELPVSNPRTFHAESYAFANGQPALHLRTILLTLFYPTTQPERGKHEQHVKGTVGWLGQSKLKSIQGLLKYASIPQYFALPAILPAYQALFAKLPVAQCAPLAEPDGILPNRREPSDPSTSSSGGFPTAIFSHGLGGTSLTYASYLSELASHGVVVAAVEHRDGTCPCSTTRIRSSDDKGKASIREEHQLYFKEDEVKKNKSEGSADKWAFRQAQLSFRQAEVAEAFRVLELLDSGKASTITSANTYPLTAAQTKTAGLEDWSGRLNLTSGLTAIGHSFGGATMLQCLSPPSQTSGAPPFSRGILLDPWLEPIPASPTPTSAAPLYVLNSQAFTIWVSHFERLRSIASSCLSSNNKSTSGSGRGYLMTMSGTKHTDFSDFPLVIPRLFTSDVKPELAIETFAVLSRDVIFSSLTPTSTTPTTTAAATDATKSERGKGEGEEEIELGGGATIQKRAEVEGEVAKRDLGPPGVLIRHKL